MADYLDVHRLMQKRSAGQLSRRDFMKRAVALGFTAPAIAGLLSACAPAEPGQTTAPAQPAEPVATAEAVGEGEGRRFDNLIVALNTDLASLDLMWGTPNINRDVMGHVYEFLFTMGDGNIYIPDLAESMDVSSDGTVFTITLRQGVNFHNGKVMTAEDVLASMQRWERMTQRGASLLNAKESITALDDHTIEIVFSEPNGGFLYGIGHYGGLFGVLPKEIVDKYYDESAERPDSQITEISDAIGTGPYRVTEWVLDRSVVMERFEDYSAREEPIDGRGGQRHAYAGRIEFIPVPDATTRLNGLIAGEYHIAYDLAPAQHDQVVSDPNLIPFVIKPGSKAVGVFNKQKGPFSDQKLRQAALAATDAFEVMAGTVDNPEFYGAFASLAGPEWAFWYTEEGKELYETRDLEKARQLIAETDYNGEPLRWITTREFDYMYRSALIAAQQWAEAGLNVELVVADWPTVITDRSNPDAYEIFSTGIGFAGDPLGTSAYTSNWPGWTTSPGVTGAYANLITETDQEKRRELWIELQRAFYEEVPYIQFGERYAFRAVRAEVKGFTDRPDFMVWNVWLDS